MSKAYELDDGQACIRQTDWDVGLRRMPPQPTTRASATSSCAASVGGSAAGCACKSICAACGYSRFDGGSVLAWLIGPCGRNGWSGGDRGGADWTARSAAIGRADHRVRQQQRRHRGGHHDGPRGDPHRRPRLHPPAPPRHAPGATALAVLIAILAHWPNPRHSCLVSCPGNFGTSIAMDGVGERRVLSD
eukprot:8111816-Pyramimonas_sp.AAC.1